MPNAGLCLKNARLCHWLTRSRDALREALASGCLIQHILCQAVLARREKVPSLGVDIPAWGHTKFVNFNLLIQGGASEGSCGPCPAGSFCPGLGLSSPISSCVAGSECSWDLRTSSSMAFLCPQVPPQERQEGAWSPRLAEARDPHPGFKLEPSNCRPQAGFWCLVGGTLTLLSSRLQFFLQCPHPAS